MDSRGPSTLESDRNNQGDAGESARDGSFQAHDFGREDFRGEVPGVDSDARFVHDVGDCAADEDLPRGIA